MKPESEKRRTMWLRILVHPLFIAFVVAALEAMTGYLNRRARN